MSRKTFVLSLLFLVVAGWFGFDYFQHWRQQDLPDSEYDLWIPLPYLQSTGDIALITGSFGGFTEDDRFRIITTKHVVTTEGTYADTQTQIAVFGPESVLQSAATGATVSFPTLQQLTNGSQISVLVQRSRQNRPVVNAYVVIIP